MHAKTDKSNKIHNQKFRKINAGAATLRLPPMKSLVAIPLREMKGVREGDDDRRTPNGSLGCDGWKITVFDSLLSAAISLYLSLRFTPTSPPSSG